MAHSTRPDFSTAISRVEPGRVSLRGYDFGEVIRSATNSEALFLVLKGRRPAKAELAVFVAALVSCAEHGFANSASIAARYVVSGSASIPAALAAGIMAFGQHTGTANLTASMLGDIAKGRPAEVSAATIHDYVASLRADKTPVPGLGHPVHRDVDPRETSVRAVASSCGFESPHSELLDRVHETANAILGRQIVLNVDGLIGALLLDMGFEPDEILAVNIIGAMPGVAAHALEDLAQGNRLRFPAPESVSYEATGPDKPWKTPR